MPDLNPILDALKLCDPKLILYGAFGAHIFAQGLLVRHGPGDISCREHMAHGAMYVLFAALL